MSATNHRVAGLDIANIAKMDVSSDPAFAGDLLPLPRLDLSASTLNRALRDVALEDLALVRARYTAHRDPVRCAVGISLVLRSLAKELFGEERINRLRQVSWLNFLLRTANPQQLRPDFLETMSAALYRDPSEMELPRDCTFWFEVAEEWIHHQRDQLPITTCLKPVEIDL